MSGKYKTILCVIALCLWGIPLTNAQELPASSPFPSSLRKSPGRLLTRGKNKVPVGELNIITYRLEEVSLPEPLFVDRAGSRIKIENAIRLTVILDRVRGGPYTIWINDDGYFAVQTKENEITALIVGTDGLENDATIVVKQGVGCRISAHSTLPDKLEVPKRLRSNKPSTNSENFVRQIRALRAATSSSDGNIEIELVTSIEFPVRNEVMVLQIGEREFEGDPYRPNGQTLRFTIPADEFRKTRDGEVIKVKYGACSMGGVRFGRLDKSLLHQ